MSWTLMSERAPDEGDDVVVQTTDGGLLFFGYVKGRHVHGSLECSPRPIGFHLVHRWFPVPRPPELRLKRQDIPF